MVKSARLGSPVHEVAEQKINEGLSLVPRLLIAFGSAAFGLVMVLVAPPTHKAPLFGGFAGFCFLIAVACVTRSRMRRIVGSLIGAALFTITLGYIGYELLNGPIVSGSRSEPSRVMAIVCFFAFGLPGIRYAWKARFGLSPSKSPDPSAT